MLSALGGSLIGGLFAFLGLIVGQRMTLQREREHKAVDAKEHRDRQRVAFQAETLVKLQDGLFQLARSIRAIHHELIMVYRKSDEWGGILISEEWNQKSSEAMAITSILQVRIDDDEVRRLVRVMKDAATAHLFTRTADEADLQIDKLGKAFVAANERIGVLLREMQ